MEASSGCRSFTQYYHILHSMFPSIKIFAAPALFLSNFEILSTHGNRTSSNTLLSRAFLLAPHQKCSCRVPTTYQKLLNTHQADFRTQKQQQCGPGWTQRPRWCSGSKMPSHSFLSATMSSSSSNWRTL